MFVDESKSRSFVLVGAICPDDIHQELRADLRENLLAGQQRLHFSRESDPRRRSILKVLLKHPIRVAVVDVPKSPSEIEARILALGHLLSVTRSFNVNRLCIEEDTSNVGYDRRVIQRSIRGESTYSNLSYSWLRAAQEPLLWVPDAVAWAWFRAGVWRRAIEPLIAWKWTSH
jgi:hypothetical protein